MAEAGELLLYVGGPILAGVTSGLITQRPLAGFVAAIVLIVCFHIVDVYLLRSD